MLMLKSSLSSLLSLLHHHYHLFYPYYIIITVIIILIIICWKHRYKNVDATVYKLPVWHISIKITNISTLWLCNSFIMLQSISFFSPLCLLLLCFTIALINVLCIISLVREAKATYHTRVWDQDGHIGNMTRLRISSLQGPYCNDSKKPDLSSLVIKQYKRSSQLLWRLVCVRADVDRGNCICILR